MRGDSDDADEPLDDGEEVPIDILENMRGRSTRHHVSDEAVGKEIERRYHFLHNFNVFNSFQIFFGFFFPILSICFHLFSSWFFTKQTTFFTHRLFCF